MSDMKLELEGSTPALAYQEAHSKPKLATLNQATIIGPENAAFDALLEREVEFMTGLMFGAKNRKNTQDGEWTAAKLTLAQLAQGVDKENGAPACSGGCR